MTTFYSNGKLLLSAEYLILDGALALALPTKYGQSLSVVPIDNNHCTWESYDADGNLWLNIKFTLSDFETVFKDSSALSDKRIIQLQKILRTARLLNPKFLMGNQNYKIQTKLSFPRQWGLGSSSTLINNMAQWAQVDAYELQFKCFGGSAYDVACAQSKTPILYQLKNQKPIVKPVIFNPIFKEHLYFVYLNKKQNSREGIKHYQSIKGAIKNTALEVSEISKEMLNCTKLSDFERLINQHELIIGKRIQTKPIKEQLFSDYFGSIKSLGAWGGDFILATGNDTTPNYFINKGFNTVIPFTKMVLAS